MEKFLELRGQAQRNIQIADHMLNMTFPLVQDPRLLMAVLENVFLALTFAMGSLLHYDRLFKKIPPFHDTFESKFNIFRLHSARVHKIEESYVFLIEDIKSIILHHRKSPIEFSRKGEYIICYDDYKTRRIFINQIKTYISKAKNFLLIVASITSKNQEIFKKQ